MRKSKKLIAGLIVISCLGSSTLAMYCASSNREAWDNAASKKETSTQLENGDEVYFELNVTIEVGGRKYSFIRMARFMEEAL